MSWECNGGFARQKSFFIIFSILSSPSPHLWLMHRQFVKHMAFAHEMKGYAEKKPLNFCCPLCFFEDNSEKKFSAHYEKCLVLWTKNNKEKMNQEPKPEVCVQWGLCKNSPNRRKLLSRPILIFFHNHNHAKIKKMALFKCKLNHSL